MRLRILASFHYHRDTDLDRLVSDLGGDVDLFADSGAYSAFTSGAVIEREEYSAWLVRWAHLFSTRSNLDVIGDAAGSADNLAWLRAQGHEIVPVFHIGEPFDVLRELCEANPYVALGGMVSFLAFGKANINRAHIMRWMIRTHLIAQKHGTVLHAFGCTGSLFLRDLPFYSADSSSYVFGRKRGLVYLWDERSRSMRSVHFRDRAGARRHFHLFRSHGLDPGTLLHPEFMVSGTDHFDEDRIKIVTAGIRAFRRMERSFVARHAVASPNNTDVGTKIYFVKTSTKYVDNEPFRRASQEENDA